MANDSRTTFNTLKSACSTRSVLGRDCIEDQVNLRDVILAAVAKFECPINVDVHRNSLPGFGVHKLQKPEKKAHFQKTHTPMVSTVGSDSNESISLQGKRRPTPDLDGSALILTALHNEKNRLLEISMYRYRYQQIPRVMMQVLGVILPSYKKLFKFTIKDCWIDKYTNPELMNILSVTNITDICLDASFLPEGNYDVLLQQSTSLQNLSLQGCNINDEVCKQIASKLHYRQPAESKLVALNLSSNHISDEGAKSIGEALRNNRHLRYLNLANNQITDHGSKHIFSALKEFALTSDEVIHKRQHRMKYLRKLLAVYNRSTIDVENNSISKSRKLTKRQLFSISSGSPIKSTRSKGSSRISSCLERLCLADEIITDAKRELIGLELVGPYDHPFEKSQVVMKNGDIYSKGNLVLCYLNLAYNHMMFPSLEMLLDVLEYQEKFKDDNLSGLIKVVLDGNNLPVECTELNKLNIIFKKITRKLAKSKSVKDGL